MHLTSNGCLVGRIEMLTYSRVRSAFNPRDALPLIVIGNFETISTVRLPKILLVEHIMLLNQDVKSRLF
jgi:hypothetical protein